MSKNLRQQLRTVVMNAFSEHLDKHAIKAQEHHKEYIYSYSSKCHLLDFIDTFCKTDGLPRNPAELTKKHAVDFLDVKATAGCSQKTLNTYRSDLAKIGRLIGIDLSVDRVLATTQRDTHRGSTDVISNDDLQQLTAYAKTHPSKSGDCVRLEALIGVRVSDLAYGIVIDQDCLHIRCKNGKYIDRSVTPEIRAIINGPIFKTMITPAGTVIAPQDDSINKWLRRTEGRLGLQRHSFHAIRRRIAQNYYDDCRRSGCGRSEALSATSIWLNHGDKRERMLLQSYIANPW